jgi:glycosyltransferase involved in cell wall biosynthesis
MNQGRVLVPLLAPSWGGIHAVALNLNPFMQKAGWPWLVILPEEAEAVADRLQQGGVDVLRLPLSRIRKSLSVKVQYQYFTSLATDIKLLADVIKEREISVVQAVGIHHLQVGFAAKRANAPLVWQIHSASLPRPLRYLFTPVALGMTDHLMTNGIKVGTEFPGVEKFADRKSVFYAPINPYTFQSSQEKRNASRAELNLKPENIVIGTIGNRTRQKAQDVLIRTGIRLFENNPHVRIVILGAEIATNRDYYKTVVEPWVTKANALHPELVQILNAGTRVSELIHCFDIFCMTSVTEGVPVALFEAMASSLPVVSFDVGSVSEIIADGKTGFLIPNRDEEILLDKLGVLVSDRELRDRCSKQSTALLMESFSIQDVAKAHTKAYDAAIQYHMLKRNERV